MNEELTTRELQDLRLKIYVLYDSYELSTSAYDEIIVLINSELENRL